MDFIVTVAEQDRISQFEDWKSPFKSLGGVEVLEIRAEQPWALLVRVKDREVLRAAEVRSQAKITVDFLREPLKLKG